MRNPREPRLARSTLVGDADPYTTYADPDPLRPFSLALNAPTITSARPSPFTSPAPATDSPAKSPSAAPSIRTFAPDRRSTSALAATADGEANPPSTTRTRII